MSRAHGSTAGSMHPVPQGGVPPNPHAPRTEERALSGNLVFAGVLGDNEAEVEQGDPANGWCPSRKAMGHVRTDSGAGGTARAEAETGGLPAQDPQGLPRDGTGEGALGHPTSDFCPRRVQCCVLSLQSVLFIQAALGNRTFRPRTPGICDT